MSSVRARKDNGLLFLDFRYQGKRCREQTTLEDTKRNRKRLETVLAQIDAEITLGTFDYRRFFPNSARASLFDSVTHSPATGVSSKPSAPTFREFAAIWWAENEIRWRRSTKQGNRAVLNRHLLPAFGDRRVNEISKADVLLFRAEVAQQRGRSGNETLTPKTINNLMGVFNMIMSEALVILPRINAGQKWNFLVP